MSREYPSAVAAFASRLRRRVHAEPGGPRLPNRRAVESGECGPETTPNVRAAAAAYDRMNRGGDDDDDDADSRGDRAQRSDHEAETR